MVLDEVDVVDKEMNEGSVLEDHTVLENGEIINIATGKTSPVITSLTIMTFITR